MAFITTKSPGGQCYSCGKQCINVEFCSEGGSYEQGVSLSRNIKVSIIANPEFWGFGGVLISGWAEYTNGYYDFFDGHDEDHLGYKTCDGVTSGPFSNEQRPDVFFRSVYDPDTGKSKHYGSNGSFEGYGPGRGGAEVYLVDRPKGLISNVTSDNPSCDDLDPTKVFKKSPENFGWGNKINFNTKIYKNLSGAWRLTSIENCYDVDNIYQPPGYLVDCSGEEKQNISSEYKRYQKYEHTRLRASGESSYYNYVSGCRPDGAVAGKYAGYFPNVNSIYRDISDSQFIQARLSYGSYGDPIPASGLKNGMTIGIKTDVNPEIFNNIYTIFDVNHSVKYTSVKFVGTSTGNAPLTANMPTGNFATGIGDSGHWVAFGSYDEQTCCGLSAYGVSDENKGLCDVQNYHTDFRRVFNNPKNLRQSNRDREWRYDYDLFDTIQPVSASISGAIDRTYPSVSGVTISGVEYFYPIIVSGDSYIVASGADPIESGHALFERVKSYYGSFFDTDRCDNIERFDQAINRGKSRNATCYSKNATLEIFPDCLTQYDWVDKSCEGGKEYITNRVPRLAFVYRGCDFNDECSFDDNGLPLGQWKSQGSAPTGIEDLKRQLGGQEIHMFINLGRSWGGRKPKSPCQCDCDGENDGFNLPSHVYVDSPITFPSFPNFDLNPSGYGCYDEIYQAKKAIQLEGKQSCSQRCDTLPISDYACLPRQPYVTYGYIMNLCGKEDHNRKDIITEAFSKLYQEKTYTNANPENDIIEPMYWNVIAPDPAPVYGGGVWSSGSDPTNSGRGKFSQIAGSGYGYWGLGDVNNLVSAPYFVTEESYNVCCQATGYYIQYSQTGTWNNVLSTSNGWPTSRVPFLVEIELDDSCAACPSTIMKDVNLHLELSGLNTEFIFNDDNRYGHSYCAYGSILEVGKGKLDRPDFSCQDGFDLEYCEGKINKSKYSTHVIGNTCNCVDDFSTALYPIKVKNTEIIAGWTSNPGGGASGLVEISDCWNSGSAFFDFAENQIAHRGYRVFAEFKLGCNNHDSLIVNPECPAEETVDLVTSLWNNPNLCTHSYPAKIGQNEGLDLQTNLYFVADPIVPVFRRFNEAALREREFTGSKTNYPCIWSGDFFENGIFGVCDGDIVYGYGCYVGNPVVGPPGFYGCIDPFLACSGKSACTTCPQYDPQLSPDGINCVCVAVDENGAVVSGNPVGWGGMVPRALPPEWTNNTCSCDCRNPTLAHTYQASGGGLVLIDGDPCRDIYWMSTQNMESPIHLGGCGIHNSEGFGDKERNIPSVNYYDWSHGVNALISGVKYELYEPSLGRETETNNFCTQLLKTTSIGFLNQTKEIIDCENTGCASDNNVNSSTCGSPIYATGTFDGVTVRKKKCNPEIAIVTKIECIPGGGYDLHLSREYHEHDRTWYEKILIEIAEGEFIKVCVPINAGAYIYNDGNNSGCHTMNYSLLADAVTPASNTPCSINPSSGVFVGQDYQYLDTGFPSGSPVWNYFNLFYSSNYLPSVDYGNLIPSVGRDENGNIVCDGTPLQIANTGTVFTQDQYEEDGYHGIFATNNAHSCVQDAIQCGGEIWCNKMFFPRNRYKENTRIAAFGSPSICTANGEFDRGLGVGYIENNSIISSAKPLLEEQKLKFIDFCNDDLVQLLRLPIDIDDTTIRVDDYLPLIGVTHPGWRFTLDVKSCTVGGNGCQDSIPSHTDGTIFGGIHRPKTFTQNGFESMGYYLDAFGVSYSPNGFISASGSDQCLFSPFKIMLDVECSLNRIQRKAFDGIDEPTMLEGVQEWPSIACKGTRTNPQCICDSTMCNYNYGPKQGPCPAYALFGGVGTLVNGSYYDCESIVCNGGGGTGEEGDPVVPCSVSGIKQEGNYILPDEDVDYTRAALHPDLLSAPSEAINGILESGNCCAAGCCEEEYTCFNPVYGNWQYNSCDGKYYNIIEYVNALTWTCQGNSYLFRHPIDVAMEGGECHCTNINNSLCDAQIFCGGDFSRCECNPIPAPNLYFNDPGNPNETLTQDGMMDDCDCQGFPLADLDPCPSRSLIKWTITE